MQVHLIVGLPHQFLLTLGPWVGRILGSWTWKWGCVDDRGGTFNYQEFSVTITSAKTGSGISWIVECEGILSG